MHEPTVDRIRAAHSAATDEARMPDGCIRPYALGWATVDLDRAASELARDLGFSAEAFEETIGSQVLGARCRVAAGALGDGLSLAILEPATEGRLAATLARLGEGPAVAWYLTHEDGAAGALTLRVGPFGVERLVAGDPIHGPHRFLIWPAAGTILP